MSKKKGLDFDIQKIIAWCKSNVVLVILILVSIGAIAGFPRMASSWNESVETKLQERASSFNKLGDITKTKVTKPGTGQSEKVVVNQALVDAYTQVTESLRGDAEEVVTLANKKNQKEYAVLLPDSLFPAPSPEQKNTLPQLFHEQLEIDYKVLLELVNAGNPPSQEELSSELENARVRFMETNLSTRQDADLTQEQRTGLEVHLAKLRMSALRSRAEGIGVYMSESSLKIPMLDVTIMPGVSELFVWQWRYWIVADVLGAVAEVNGDQSEVTSPIKRLALLEVLGLPEGIDDSSTSGGSNPKGGPKGGPSGGAAPPKGGPSKPKRRTCKPKRWSIKSKRWPDQSSRWWNSIPVSRCGQTSKTFRSRTSSIVAYRQIKRSTL